LKANITQWVVDFINVLFKKVVEYLLRLIWFFLPMGLFLILLQLRTNASKVSNLSVYTNDKSVWQQIFPGFILVAIDKDYLRNYTQSKKQLFQKWIENNKYVLCFLFMFLVVVIMIVKG